MFKELSATLEEGIKEMVIPETSVLNNEAEFHVSVLDFQPGSVNVHYRYASKFWRGLYILVVYPQAS